MKEKTLHKDNNLKSSDQVCSLILYNDNFNTFDHVIKTLVEVCDHDFIQAEQCALIVHLRGSYEIKTGPKEILGAMCRSLNAKGLSSKVTT